MKRHAASRIALSGEHTRFQKKAQSFRIPFLDGTVSGGFVKPHNRALIQSSTTVEGMVASIAAPVT